MILKSRNPFNVLQSLMSKSKRYILSNRLPVSLLFTKVKWFSQTKHFTEYWSQCLKIPIVEKLDSYYFCIPHKFNKIPLLRESSNEKGRSDYRISGLFFHDIHVDLLVPHSRSRELSGIKRVKTKPNPNRIEIRWLRGCGTAGALRF